MSHARRRWWSSASYPSTIRGNLPPIDEPPGTVHPGSMLRRFEALLDPTGPEPNPPPTAGLVRFYWHYIRQARWLSVALYIVGGLIAIVDTTIPTFIGRVVGLVSP